MNARLLWAQSMAVMLLVAAVAGAAEPASSKPSATRDAQQLAAKIDQHLSRSWAESKTEPAARTDDAEFLRRVSLDLAGRIPSAEETRTFLDDQRPEKRSLLVEKILASPRYALHFTNVWRGLLLPEASNNFLVQAQLGSFDQWLKQELSHNVGYDQMVRDLLTTKIGGGNGFQSLTEGFSGAPSPQVYYLAKEFKPENLAAGTARIFLGVSVECAQCHNHPFADWKREQFWGMAAFFSGIKSQRLMDFLLPNGDDVDKHELTLPGTEKVIQARFLDGTQPTWKEKAASRETLAAWVTAKDNPYFARTAVNRVWAYFYGTGLVEPVDDMVGGSNSAASHPKLLDLLAQEFIAHDFDLKFLIRAIVATQSYQLTSARSDKSTDDRTKFARMPLRGLTGEQLFDSLAQATGYRDASGGGGLLSALGGSRSARSEFLARFASTDRPADTQTSILQALALMNGKVTAAATTVEKSETLASVVDAPFLNTDQRIETLYLATLSRKPTAKELERAEKFVKNAKGKDSEALSDLFWALLNSPEFILNH